MQEIYFEIPILATEVAALVSDAGVRVTYTSGPIYEQQSGRLAELSVIITNSPLNGGPIDVMRDLATRIAPLSVNWLRRTERLIQGTIITVTFADAKQLGPFSMFNALETMAFDLVSGGELLPVESGLSTEREESMRRLRYRMSGRRAPRS